jgi:hypothetical protein
MRAHTIAPAFIFLALAGGSAHAELWTVTSNADDDSPGCLRWCIEHAEPGDEIQFDPALDGQPILLNGGPVVLDKDITITGRGPAKTVWRGHRDRVLVVRDAVVAVSGVTIEGGRRGSSNGGAGIHQERGRLTLTDSVVRDNRIGLRYPWGIGAGGIYVYDGSLRIERSSISDNHTTAYGGLFSAVLLLCEADAPRRIEIVRSTISDNSSRGVSEFAAGGISNYGCAVEIDSSTISGNAWDPDWPLLGGIANGGFLRLVHSTVTANHGPGIATVPAVARTEAVGSIVAGNEPGWYDLECLGGPIASFGHNLDSDGSCGFDHPTDQPNTDPMLSPLKDNGGPTWTHAPLEGSPVIDRGWCDPGTDQRGVPRPIDGNLDNVWLCDIGAVEYVPYCDGPDRPCDGKEYEMIGPLGRPIVIVF